MKIELNTPALERLIGGDTAVELALRKQIVHTFTGRHLQRIAEERVVQQQVNAIQAYIDEVVKQELGIEAISTSTRWSAMTTQLRSLVRTCADEIIQEVVAEALKDFIAKQKRWLEHEIRIAIEKAMAKQIEVEVQQGIRERLDAAAAAARVAAGTGNATG